MNRSSVTCPANAASRFAGTRAEHPDPPPISADQQRFDRMIGVRVAVARVGSDQDEQFEFAR
jgi:hypothetical protein